MTLDRRPFLLVAIDPGLANTGLVVARVKGYAAIQVMTSLTIRTEPADGLPARLRAMRQSLDELFRAQQPAPTVAIIEDPTTMIQRDAKGQRKDPRTLYGLMAAYGALLTALTYQLPTTAITTVSVNGWYPRRGRGQSAKADVLVMLRQRFASLFAGPKPPSEHVIMATGLAHWWSCQVAPRLWFEQERESAKMGAAI